MLGLLVSIKEQAHKVPALEALRERVHQISAPQKDNASSTEIRFHPSLLAELEADHQLLISQFDEMGLALKQKSGEKLKSRLDNLAKVLRGHVLKKNLKLYLYLQHSMDHDQQRLSLINGFKREMREISKAVNDFLRKYSGMVPEGESSQAFAGELAEIKERLSEHTEREEKELFPLYAPA